MSKRSAHTCVYMSTIWCAPVVHSLGNTMSRSRNVIGFKKNLGTTYKHISILIATSFFGYVLGKLNTAARVDNLAI